MAFFVRLLPFFAFIALLSGCSSLGVPHHKGTASENFDGELFFNPWEIQTPGQLPRGSLLRFIARRVTGASDRGPWPEWVHQLPGDAPPARVHTGIRITFAGHASALIQTQGLNILTDPVWSHQVGPNRIMSVGRHKNAGIRFEDLPEIDAIVISHNHYDHLDLPTLRRLQARQPGKPLRIYAGLGNTEFLRENGIPGGVDLDWWQIRELSGSVKVQAVPAQHWSTRIMVDRNRSLWAGYILHTPDGKIYFAGDTGYGKFVQDIRERVGPVRVGILPIGAYLPRAFSRNHISPEEAVRIHRELGAEVSIPMHYGTFRQSDEAYEQPVADLAQALVDQKLDPAAFAVLRECQSWEVSR